MKKTTINSVSTLLSDSVIPFVRITAANGEQLGDLMAPLGLGWRARTHAELALMAELVPLLRKRAQGRDISGLNAYEQ